MGVRYCKKPKQIQSKDCHKIFLNSITQSTKQNEKAINGRFDLDGQRQEKRNGSLMDAERRNGIRSDVDGSPAAGEKKRNPMRNSSRFGIALNFWWSRRDHPTHTHTPYTLRVALRLRLRLALQWLPTSSKSIQLQLINDSFFVVNSPTVD